MPKVQKTADVVEAARPLEHGTISEGSVEFRVPSDPKILKIIRGGIAHLCELIGFSEPESKSIMLAVDEACSNIMKHTYAGAVNRPIVVSCSMLGNGIKVVLRDVGKKVSKHKIKARELDEVRPGGLGVHIIQSVMDEVFYDDACTQGNCLTLIKYLQHKKEDL
ncbi:MAG: ATP-binding protein [Deferribacteres bacterium]|nr:ATP-binding protein [candidate division KSB1 bacterium]MCB9509442.1 ATP-binding protein [Deferribacteres bacterium]